MLFGTFSHRGILVSGVGSPGHMTFRKPFCLDISLFQTTHPFSSIPRLCLCSISSPDASGLGPWPPYTLTQPASTSWLMHSSAAVTSAQRRLHLCYESGGSCLFPGILQRFSASSLFSLPVCMCATILQTQMRWTHLTSLCSPSPLHLSAFLCVIGLTLGMCIRLYTKNI